MSGGLFDIPTPTLRELDDLFGGESRATPLEIDESKCLWCNIDLCPVLDEVPGGGYDGWCAKCRTGPIL